MSTRKSDSLPSILISEVKRRLGRSRQRPPGFEIVLSRTMESISEEELKELSALADPLMHQRAWHYFNSYRLTSPRLTLDELLDREEVIVTVSQLFQSELNK